MNRRLLALLVALPAGLLAERTVVVQVALAHAPLSGANILALAGLHFFGSVALAEALDSRYRPGEPGAAGAWSLGLTLALLVPGFGALLVGILIARPPRTDPRRIEGRVAPMEFRRQQAEAQLAAEADRGHAGVQVEAIGDALKDEDREKRLGAVAALRSLQNKHAVGLLGKSLKNTVFEVRYHAVEALAAINKTHSNRIAIATAAVERSPTPDSHRALGEAYHEYASLEMEEVSIQQHLYRNAADNLRKAITPETSPPPIDLLLKLAGSLEALDDYEEARHTFEAVVAQDPQNREALLAAARFQYRKCQFRRLPETCQKILDLGTAGLDQGYVNVLTLWAQGPSETEPAK